MIQTVDTVALAGSLADREVLRRHLEATRAAFHARLAAVRAERWMRVSPASKWTMAEVFVHLTWSLEMLPKEVEQARHGKGMFNMPKWLADPGSYWLTRFMARNVTPEQIARRYDAAMDAAIAALNSVPDSDWALGANFYGHGFHNVVDLFNAPAQHLAEHTEGV